MKTYASKDTGAIDYILLVKVSVAAILLQLFFVILGFIVTGSFGPKPDTVTGYYEMMQDNKLIGLLRDDFHSFMIIVLYLFSFMGLFFIVRKKNLSLSVLAVSMSFIAVILCIASHSGFSMMYLSDQYAAATGDSIRSQIIAAGESVIAQNMWNGTAAFFSGVFLQGGGLLISLAMLGDKSFHKLTVYSGLLANGLDLVNHLIHYSAPSLANIFLYIAGPFYIVWYVMLSIDLINYIKSITASQSVNDRLKANI